LEKTLEKKALEVLASIQKAGYEAYFAGGCVRDRLLGNEPLDFDIATNAKTEEIQKVFPKTVPVGVAFGVVLVIHEGSPFQVATFRTEGNYQDGRRPEKVTFATVEEDAKRRDFTVNGLYWDGKSKNILDLIEGQKDLQKKVIRTIGNAEERFLEDHLRILRAIRFAVQLGFEIEAATWAAAKKHAAKVELISKERIREEFSKILISQAPARGIELLDEAGLLPFIVPEALKMKGVEQPMQYHPEGDVYVHTLLLLKQLSRPPLELALGALLHDIAKPDTFQRAPDRIRFHGHDRIGAEKTREIMKRLCYSNDQIELVAALVLDHLKFKDAFEMRTSSLKRFISQPRFDLHLELHRIDCLASHGDLRAYEFCKKAYEEFLKEPSPPPKYIKGEDLIALGMKPGPEFAKIIREVEDKVLEGDITSRDQALEYVKSNRKQNG